MASSCLRCLRRSLAAKGWDPAYGARPLKRALQKLIQDPLALKILDGEVLHGDHVVVTADEATHALKFEVVRHAADQLQDLGPGRGEPMCLWDVDLQRTPRLHAPPPELAPDRRPHESPQPLRKTDQLELEWILPMAHQRASASLTGREDSFDEDAHGSRSSSFRHE